MTDRALRRAKRELRELARAARDALAPEERAAAGESILARILALPFLDETETVALYASFGSEVPTGPFLDRLVGEGYRVALPRVSGGEIELVRHRPGDPMRRADYGALEPAGRESVAPEEFDLILTPGLAFDPAGHRLGYGGGFYDRLFRRSRTEAVRLGLAFDLQVVELVPSGPGDEAVDGVVTERRTLWAQPPRRVQR